MKKSFTLWKIKWKISVVRENENIEQIFEQRANRIIQITLIIVAP